MSESENVKKIADLITDDPDIFNEMAVGTGGVAFGVVGSVKPKRKKRKQANEDDDDLDDAEAPDAPKFSKFYADPITGKSKVKTGKSHSKEAGEVMMGDKDSPDESLEEDA